MYIHKAYSDLFPNMLNMGLENTRRRPTEQCRENKYISRLCHKQMLNVKKIRIKNRKMYLIKLSTEGKKLILNATSLYTQIIVDIRIAHNTS